MLPTFVIGLREGLEAALIVGIVAGFLRQRGRGDLLGAVWVGVSAAVLLCLAAGVGLQVLNAELPQSQQEGLETIVGAAAVLMVSYMVLWMGRHGAELKGHLEHSAGSALASGSAWALVGMAFLAVLREGLETAVFLLATFQSSIDPKIAAGGAIAGIALAVVMGYGIYRGGVRLDLARFFRATSLLLILVAAGLVMTALHTAHEAGWLNAAQQPVLNLRWLLQPGSIVAALLTGMLGLQPQPTRIELAGWLLYAIPMTALILRPRAPRLARRAPLSLPGHAS